MANVESAVVVYLRLLYYPSGFSFPIVKIPLSNAIVELAREAATLVMLYSIAHLSYKKALHRFCAFMYCFGIWDISYYIWLYIFIAWPSSLLTWDILFLLPLPWLGPVLAPVLVSIALIIASLIIIILEEKGKEFHNTLGHWFLAILSGLIIIFSFILNFRVVTEGTVPRYFPWWIFFLGYISGIAVFVQALVKTRKLNK
jgi:hypothetical protein